MNSSSENCTMTMSVKKNWFADQVIKNNQTYFFLQEKTATHFNVI